MEKASINLMIARLLADVTERGGHAALFFDRQEHRLTSAGDLPPFCRWCLNTPALAARCHATYAEAAGNAMNAAEPFYYNCWAGLLFVAIAIAPFTHCRGCAAISGFRTAGDTWNAQAAADDAAVIRGESSDSRRPAALFAAAPQITTTRLRHLGAYLEDSGFAAGLNSAAYFQQRHAVYLEQRAIAEYAKRLTPAALNESALARRADALIAKLPGLNAEQLRRSAARYLAAVLKSCTWDLARLKAHLRIPLAMLARNALLRGADWSIAVKNEMRFVARLDQARAVEDACQLFIEILGEAAGQTRQPAHRTLPVTERVIRWLEENYAQPATLARAARAIGASSSAIIKHVRRDTGKTFHDLLLETRIAESKRLLANTRMDLSMIAQQCGFYDQSHFSRHFQRAINITPGHFRKLMKFSETDILS